MTTPEQLQPYLVQFNSSPAVQYEKAWCMQPSLQENTVKHHKNESGLIRSLQNAWPSALQYISDWGLGQYLWESDNL